MVNAAGKEVNQLDDMVSSGLILGWDTHVVPWPEPTGTAPLALRARAYLATNCAFCHLPGGASGTQVDWRYDTPLAKTNACGVAPSWGDANIAGAQILFPADVQRSIASYRMHSREVGWKMPPVGHDAVDPNGSALIDAWIAALTSCDE